MGNQTGGGTPSWMQRATRPGVTVGGMRGSPTGLAGSPTNGRPPDIPVTPTPPVPPTPQPPPVQPPDRLNPPVFNRPTPPGRSPDFAPHTPVTPGRPGPFPTHTPTRGVGPQIFDVSNRPQVTPAPPGGIPRSRMR